MRGRQAFEKSHIKGAVNIPLEELRQRLDEYQGIEQYIYTVELHGIVIMQYVHYKGLDMII